MEKLIVGPFQATKIPTLIVIDALDECQDEEPASVFLSVLSRYVDKIPVKFFITGRPEPRIRSGFRLESLRPHTDVLKLHEVQPSLVDNDIKLFLRTRFTEIAKNQSDCNFEEDWPGPYYIDVLSRKAAGFFIYASTVFKFVSSPLHLPDERLHLIFHFGKTPLMKGDQALISSTPKSWSKLSMMWIPMIISSTPASNLWWA